MNDNRIKHEYTGLEIAVIGLSCRFPGANNINEFWENIKNGVETIQFFTTEEVEATNSNRDFWDKPNFIPAIGTVENPGYFDAAFFGYKPLEAEFMDPQIRLLYECCWEALELSGYNPESHEGLIGIYAGATNNRGWEFPGITDERSSLLGFFARDHLIDRDFLSTRIAYKLNLRGPAVTLKTACSTGLVAVDLACRSLLTGQCEMALAGASSLAANAIHGYFYSEGMIASQDGHVRSFDAKSKGVVFSEGVGVTVLKRLKSAIKDRDNIYAIIKGTAVNNDGSRKGSFESPCTEGQEEAIRRAIHMAEVDPETITYVETHGTGTVIGDPIEIEGLKGAFNTEKKGYCAIGSVKSNFGHTDTTAGIAGFIKTVLVLKNRMIPPSLHFENPNPKIDFVNSPFYVNTGLKEWKNDKFPLRAGISSFGVGGTNAHAILEEAPEPAETSPSRKWQLLLLSAMTPTALEKATENLIHHIKENQAVPLPEIAYTLQMGRKKFKSRKMWILDPSAPDFEFPNISTARDKNHLIFMFSGQGAQYVNMGLDLYRTERVFRDEINQCFEILKPIVGHDLKEILYPTSAEHPNNSSMDINQTEITQPVIFVFEYAIAKLLMAWGLNPYAMIGHSIGEYVAACLSGVFSLKDALKLVAMRGKLMQQMPSGAMLSVALSEEELTPILKQYTSLSLAAVNAPNLCVVSGTNEVVEILENHLKEKNVETRNLHTSHAFHSQMMDPILKQFMQVVKEVTINKPQLPYISNLSGNWITVEETQSEEYWAEHLRKTVRFKDGLTPLLDDPYSIFIEVGPGKSLTTFVQKHKDKKTDHIILNLVKHPKEANPDDYYLLNKIGQLWLYGVDIKWEKYYSDEKRRRVPLPTYPFERQYYWLHGKSKSELITKNESEKIQEMKLKKNSEMEKWFYTPSWKQKTLSPQEIDTPLNWLIFTNPDDDKINRIATQLSESLKNSYPEDKISWVQIGTDFSFINSTNAEPVFKINPQQENDYLLLIQELKKMERIPQRILNLWNISNDNQVGTVLNWNDQYESDKNKGFYSLIYLAKSIGNEGISEKIKINVVSENMQEVIGEESIYPTRSLILGPVNILPMENQDLVCCSIDIVFPESNRKKELILLEQLLAEFRSETGDKIIAYRNQYRWVQSYEESPLPSIEQKNPTGQNDTIKRTQATFKDGGIYLITGGVGGIGLKLAQHIVEQASVKLLLTGRSAFPKREEWQEWINTHQPYDKISTKIKKIIELESSGNNCEIMVASADVSNLQQMKEVINEAETKWGKINGVIHAAGLPGGGVIQLKTPEIAEKILAPKVKGTLVLDTLLKDNPIEFYIFFSSINSVVPMFGQVDYFSANAFLDAYAHYKTTQEGIPSISINWDSWQEIGMAVEAAKQWGSNRNSNTQNINHPLFDQWLHNDQETAIFVTHFNLNRHWVLNEHKIAESGKGLVPGVTYLEMARQALESHTEKNISNQNGEIEISEVYFLNPLIVGEDENRETQLILRKTSQDQEINYEFLVHSRVSDSDSQWEKHVVGKINWRDSKEEPPLRNVDEITGNWVTNVIDTPAKDTEESNEVKKGSLLAFGPRWRSLKRLQLGEKQGLGFLSLDTEFVNELNSFKLHPALLDSSTGLLFGHVGKSAYIPFAYKKLIMRAPLTPKIYTYCRVVEEGNTAQMESLKFDITIMDEKGKELVEVKEFTMLQVSEGVKSKVKEKETSSLNIKLPQKSTSPEAENNPLKNGITPSEGMEAIDRILNRAMGKMGPLPQVVVSTIDLSTRFEQIREAANRTKQKGAMDKTDPNGDTIKKATTLLPRPTISTVYVSPKSENEQLIAQLWQNILGIEQVGINDDFFELGGDSLNVVQLNNELKKSFNMDIPVAVMFRHQTIRAFTQYLQQEKSNETPEPIQENRSDELAKSKDRLKARMRRR